MNNVLKRSIEKAARGIGLASLVRTIQWNNSLVLAYHNIVPDGEPITGDLSLHLPQRQFARQLDWLSRTHDVVPLRAIFEQQGTRGPPRAAITFDDAYRGAVTIGVKELVDRHMPATIFVAPAFVGGNAFWWDLLVTEGDNNLPTEIREHCIDVLGGQHDRVLAWADQHGISTRCVPPHQTVATEDELATCAASGKITFGSHTWSHPNLCRLDGRDVREELERPLAWLNARFDHVVPWLAYPYGLASTEAANATKRFGYEGGLLISGGRAASRYIESRRFAMPRTNISAALSLDGFALRSSGLFSR